MLKKKDINHKEKKNESAPKAHFPATLVGTLANEIASIVAARLSSLRSPARRKKKPEKLKKAVFLDTPAIIDGRIFDIVSVGLLDGTFVVLEEILLELKRIADSSDAVKRERGRRGLVRLDEIKKAKGIQLILYTNGLSEKIPKDVDEFLLKTAKTHKGKLITCDYSLEKKARIQNVLVVNVNALANALKIAAVPGESLSVKILHSGKETGQGVSYLDDGTMVVVQNGAVDIGKRITVVIARGIQTDAGKILFAKKI